ncbi:hypothetical protein TrLO_g5628 [Triparma laevis f. longispina]|uniref:Uncharacterized protein n=1 Tax=Triparma laevis f. longispina TaxID=1714387 RepID=A0A9W7CH10_9STRA|nr:hypothetical protein TrLO_g5628 [Triparma laevis f. longispina]
MFVVVGCAHINAFAALRFTGPATSRKINWKSLSHPSTKHRTEPHVFNSASLMIAIVCDAQSIWTLGPTILDTWLKDSAFDFRFFVGYQADDIPEALEPYTTLNDDYEFSGYEWYLKVDIDAYVDTNVLHNFADEFLHMRSAVGYLGNPGFGRPFERAKLGLRGPFCMGMGYIMGRETLRDLREELDWCFDNPHTNHSDTEIGNCNYRASSTTCQRANADKYGTRHGFINFSYNYDDDGRISSAQITKKNEGQIISHHHAFFGDPLNALLVHPLKSAEGGLKQARAFIRNACVNNPVAQKDVTGFRIAECEPIPSSFPASLSALSTFVLDLAHRQDRYELVEKRFDHTSLSLNRFEGVPGLTTGGLPEKQKNLSADEISLRATMANMLQHALDTDIKLLLLLDDDVIPKEDFDSRLLEVLRDERCGGGLFSETGGGILQLGAMIKSDGAWELIKEDLELTKKTIGTEPKCFNSYSQASGALAVIFHRNTFQEALDWLDRGPAQPWDEVFGWLASKGYTTRVAYPFIPLPESDIDKI